MLITGARAIAIPQGQSSSLLPLITPQKHTLIRKIKDKVSHREDKGKGPAHEANATPAMPAHTALLLTLIQSPVALREAIVQLQNRSLVACHDSSHTSPLGIHDLIQLVVVESSKKDGSEQECFELVVQLACHAFDQIEDYRSPACWPQCQTPVPHMQSLTSRQEISMEAKEQLLTANRRLALYLESRGRYREAEEVFKQVLSEWKRLFGPEDWRTLSVMYNLGYLYSLRGR